MLIKVCESLVPCECANPLSKDFPPSHILIFPSFTLSTGTGVKFVYVWFKDAEGNIAGYGASITVKSGTTKETDNSSKKWIWCFTLLEDIRFPLNIDVAGKFQCRVVRDTNVGTRGSHR